MLFLQLLEVDVETLVPRVEYKDLETERGGSDYEIGNGEAAADDHGEVGCCQR